MPEIIMEYEISEGKMIALKRKKELIRCKDCKWRDDQHESKAWLPCMELKTRSDFYCGFAERQEDGICQKNN